MTPEQISLVQESFRFVLPIRNEAAAIFYRRLFAINPDLRSLFANADMTDQGRKLVTALAFVVNGLGLSYSPLLGQISGWFKLLSAPADRFRCC